MLENLIDLIKQHAGEAVINNPAVPNDQNQAVIEEAGHSITSGLQNMISQGGIQNVLNLFHNGTTDTNGNAAVQNISGGFIQNLISKFGLNQADAEGVAGKLIPNVLQSLVHKTNDSSDSSFDLQGIISHIGGGKSIEDLLGSLTGGGGGGLMDKIKGFL